MLLTLTRLITAALLIASAAAFATGAAIEHHTAIGDSRQVQHARRHHRHTARPRCGAALLTIRGTRNQPGGSSTA